MIRRQDGVSDQAAQRNHRRPRGVFADVAHDVDEEPVVGTPKILRQKNAIGAAMRQFVWRSVRGGAEGPTVAMRDARAAVCLEIAGGFDNRTHD